ncbi:TlyA family RNA methyltransferase [Baekduia soli]|uniref:TlyA family RNA methyltransferase n=1 Tax=Baekduia soli TaxID=496014 RepID=A0A5B8U813_9ACTN|nr:TlyA family RNA methyltransferase [Baekduia soli]
MWGPAGGPASDGGRGGLPAGAARSIADIRVPAVGRSLCEAGHSAADAVVHGARGRRTRVRGVAKVRLDTLLHRRGLFASRSRAAASVMAGEVHLGAGRERAAKPGQLVAEDVVVDLAQRPRFVSRGGVKLANALAATGIAVRGRRALDVGASTGGFTDCLLQEGAEHVVALDVAYGELGWSLRTDERVTVLERANARRLQPADLPYRPDLVVADVSFISLTKVLPAVLGCVPPVFDALVMVKPQFEVGRERIGSGGVVRDPAARRDALVAVATAVERDCGVAVLGFAPSGLPGPKGNRETFAWLAEAGRPGALDAAGVAAAAAGAEPA